MVVKLVHLLMAQHNHETVTLQLVQSRSTAKDFIVVGAVQPNVGLVPELRPSLLPNNRLMVVLPARLRLEQLAVLEITVQ
jgi:hypothetical protein